MFTQQITVTQWLGISMGTRVQIAERLKLHKSGFTVVEDNKVKSDGYSQDDLSDITVEKLQTLTYSFEETNLLTLLKMAIEYIEGPARVGPFAEMLTKTDAAQFAKEYEQRTGKDAPKPEAPVEATPDEVINKIKENATKEEIIKEEIAQPAEASAKNEGANTSGNEASGGSKTPTRNRKGKTVSPTS